MLKNKLRDQWIKILDYNYVDNDIIGKLLETKKTIDDLLTFVLNKARAGNLSSTKDSSNGSKETNAINQSTQSKPKKVTIPEPFNLTKPKPRVIQEPIPISNKFVMNPIPIEEFKKTSLKKLEEEKKERLKIIKKNVLEKYQKEKPIKFKTDERPMNLEKVKEEVEKKIESTLQFNNKYVNPPKDFSSIPADVKYNEAAILREEKLINQKQKEAEAELERLLIEKKDSKEYDRWVTEMKMKDEILKMQRIQKRKMELEMNREVATTYMQKRIPKQQLNA